MSIACCLLGATNLGRAFQAHSRQSSSGHFVLLLVVVAAVVSAFLAGLYYWERRRALNTVKRDSEELLFRELCRIHGLSPAEIALLRQVAAQTGRGSDAVIQSRSANDSPASRERQRPESRSCEVFINPAWLASADEWSSLDADRVSRLREKLFGSPDADDVVETSPGTE